VRHRYSKVPSRSGRNLETRMLGEEVFPIQHFADHRLTPNYSVRVAVLFRSAMMLPARLQTSPYLTCVRPGDESPVVYMTDTLGPEFPHMTAAGDAAFGVIGLVRRGIWHRDH
jgi:hypothetical protein